MKRHLLNLATQLSVLLCAAAAALGVRSYWHSDAVATQWHADPGADDAAVRSLHAYSGRGGMMLTLWDARYRGLTPTRPRVLRYWSESEPDAPWEPLATEARPVSFHRFGFGFARRELSSSLILGQPRAAAPTFRSVGHSVWVPHWAVSVLAAVPPSIVAVRRFRRRGAGAKWCAGCGYDLRATPGRCPECGAGGKEAQVQ